MTDPDPRAALRATLAGFDQRQKKIVGGILAVMIENPDAVRNREWISEQFAQIALLSADFEHLEDVTQGVAEVQAYVQANAEAILSACFQLFQFTAEDLAPRVADGLTKQDALVHALGYFGA
ncbi:MAG: hypothetical protein H6831_00590 [Planctomycetes bacterium]|nr:hypothetical protein [Planctomycetota bacterium]MCB9902881.1 hypothetical protein [Planctomycetota bacterium]